MDSRGTGWQKKDTSDVRYNALPSLSPSHSVILALSFPSYGRINQTKQVAFVHNTCSRGSEIYSTFIAFTPLTELNCVHSNWSIASDIRHNSKVERNKLSTAEDFVSSPAQTLTAEQSIVPGRFTDRDRVGRKETERERMRSCQTRSKWY